MTTSADQQWDVSTPPRVPARTAPRTVRSAAVLWLITAGAVAAAVLAGISAPPPLRFSLPLLAHVSGMLAGYGVTVMVALMSRVPALERGIGADQLARWHGGAAGPSSA
jgi:hypothetical protein